MNRCDRPRRSGDSGSERPEVVATVRDDRLAEASAGGLGAPEGVPGKSAGPPSSGAKACPIRSGPPFRGRLSGRSLYGEEARARRGGASHSASRPEPHWGPSRERAAPSSRNRSQGPRPAARRGNCSGPAAKEKSGTARCDPRRRFEESLEEENDSFDVSERLNAPERAGVQKARGFLFVAPGLRREQAGRREHLPLAA